MEFSLIFYKTPYEQVQKTVLLPVNLTNQEVESFFKKVFNIDDNEVIELSDMQNRIHFIGNSLIPGPYNIKILSSQGPLHDDKMHSSDDEEKKEKKEKMAAKMSSSSSSSSSKMEKLPQYQNSTTTGAMRSSFDRDNHNDNPEEPCISFTDLATWPCGAVEFRFLYGTIFSILLFTFTFTIVVFPWTCAKDSCNGNVCAIYVGRVLVVALLGTLLFPIGLALCFIAFVLGLVVDILFILPWAITFGYCFQVCDYLWPHVKVGANTEKIDFPHMGAQLKRMRNGEPWWC